MAYTTGSSLALRNRITNHCDLFFSKGKKNLAALAGKSFLNFFIPYLQHNSNVEHQAVDFTTLQAVTPLHLPGFQ